MAITPAQEQAINDVINRQTTASYATYGKNFLAIPNEVDDLTAASIAKTVEQQGLTNIVDNDSNLSDIKVLEQIARWDIQRYGQEQLKQKILLYTFGHRSGYEKKVGEDRNERCVSSSAKFIEIAKSKLSPCNPPLTPIPNPDIPGDTGADLDGYYVGYQDIPTSGSDITYIGEHGTLFGHESAQHYWTATAALLFGTSFANPINYEGYAFENQKGRTNYASGGSHDRGQFFCYTPGGGPMKQTNWIIKYVQYGDYFIEERDTESYGRDVPWTHDYNGRQCMITKIYIHLFFPDGAYVRATLDRSNDADLSNVGDDIKHWIYNTYANKKATERGLSFKNVWNDKILTKEYRIVGGEKQNIVDCSFYWNGNRDNEYQRLQTAYYKNDNNKKWIGLEGEIQ